MYPVHILSFIRLIKRNSTILVLFVLLINGSSTFAHKIQYSFRKLTVLTRPVGSREASQGHPAVTRSLLAGLVQLSVPFNYNPQNKKEVGDVVVVLAHVEALRQAIDLKHKNPRMTLLAGPNLVIWPTDDGSILLSRLIDAIIVPSPPTCHMYAEIAPDIKNRLFVWYAGVDIDQWCPSNGSKAKDVLIYWKNMQEGPLLKDKVVDELRKYGWSTRVLEYGKYNQSEYKQILNNAVFGIFLSRSESQGIALAEAWAMNVPTFPWNPKERIYRERRYSMVSSCPYLTEYTGKDWKTLSDLERILKNISEQLDKFSPRSWVQENMTDRCSTRLLLDIISDVRLNMGKRI